MAANHHPKEGSGSGHAARTDALMQGISEWGQFKGGFSYLLLYYQASIFRCPFPTVFDQSLSIRAVPF